MGRRKKLRFYTIKQLLDQMSTRLEGSALELDSFGILKAMQKAVQVLNDMVFMPRSILFSHVGKEIDLMQYDIDEVVAVLTSDENAFGANQILPEVGLLPLLIGSGGPGVGGLDTLGDYLIIRSVLNMMSRQLGFGSDWERYETDTMDVLRLNKDYRWLLVSYLPFLDDNAIEEYGSDNDIDDDEDHDGDEPELTRDRVDGGYWLYPQERLFLEEYAWAEINIRSAESLFSASTLGVFKEAEQVLKYWQEERNRLEKQFNDKSVHPFIG